MRYRLDPVPEPKGEAAPAPLSWLLPVFILGYWTGSSLGVSSFPMRPARSTSTKGHSRGSLVLVRGKALHTRATQAENSNDSATQVLHCVPIAAPRGMPLQFHSFDEAYLQRLAAGEFRTQEHFVAYFGALIQVKLRSRLHSPQAIEDVRQETFARFFTA